jgi:steroid delta-isomerase-like uncharacterized protein
MSTENKALVRRFLAEGIERGDPAAFDELLAPDVADHAAAPGLPPGREGWRRNRAIMAAGFPDLRFAIEDLLADGDKVIARTVFTGTHRGDFFGLRATGKAVTVSSIHIFRIDDGRIVEHWANSDDLAMLRQLGVVPPHEALRG